MEDVLAARYATVPMGFLWTDQNRLTLEQDIWLDLLHHQADSPRWPTTRNDYQAYRASARQVTLEQVREAELGTRHQTLAHIHVWNHHAGRQTLHLGLTSSDIGTQVDHTRQKSARHLILGELEAILHQLATLAMRHRDNRTIGRTHNQPAQVTTIGRRYAMWAEQLLHLHTTVPFLPPLRRASGAVGTGADQHAYTSDTQDPPLDVTGLLQLGTAGLAAPGQSYPYALETALHAWCLAIGQTASSIAITLRLEAGQGLWHEQPDPGQIGSSAMPHKNNPRYAEQIHALNLLLQGYGNIANQAAADQWYEGDVATSAARRIYQPGIWMATDAILNTLHHILDIGEHDTTQAAEHAHTLRRQMSSGRRLAHTNKLGIDRETAHQIVASGGNVTPEEQLPGYDLGYALLQTDHIVRAIRENIRDTKPAWRHNN